MAHNKNIEESKLIDMLEKTMSYIANADTIVERKYTMQDGTVIVYKQHIRNPRYLSGGTCLSEALGRKEMSTDDYLYGLIMRMVDHLKEKRKEQRRFHYETMSDKKLKYIVHYLYEAMKDHGIIGEENENPNA